MGEQCGRSEGRRRCDQIHFAQSDKEPLMAVLVGFALGYFFDKLAYKATRPRIADDFSTIRARLPELRRGREETQHFQQAIASEPVPVRANSIGQVAIDVTRLRNAAG
jgi:hypothetical protein